MVESVFESTMLKVHLVTSSHSLDLLQVLALLGLDRASADPETAKLCLGCSTMHMAVYAACSYLTDMLHMRCLFFFFFFWVTGQLSIPCKQRSLQDTRRT